MMQRQEKQSFRSLVTGASGFLGQQLVRQLLDRGDLVTAMFSRKNPRWEREWANELKSGQVRLLQADIRDFSAVCAATKNIDFVFHAAAIVDSGAPYELHYNVNVEGTRNICNASSLNNIQRLIYISTTDVFGLPRNIGQIFSEDDPYYEQREPYPDTKIAATKLIKEYHQKHGLPITVIYPGWIYGPGDRKFVPTLAKMLETRQMVIWGCAKKFHIHLIYITDLVDAIIKAAHSAAALGQDFIIVGDNDGPTFDGFLQTIAKKLNFSTKVRWVPYLLALTLASVAQKTVKWGLAKQPLLTTTEVKSFGHRFCYSNQKARETLGWTPKTPFIEGINKAIDDYRVQQH